MEDTEDGLTLQPESGEGWRVAHVSAMGNHIRMLHGI